MRHLPESACWTWRSPPTRQNLDDRRKGCQPPSSLRSTSPVSQTQRTYQPRCARSRRQTKTLQRSSSIKSVPWAVNITPRDPAVFGIALERRVASTGNNSLGRCLCKPEVLNSITSNRQHSAHGIKVTCLSLSLSGFSLSFCNRYPNRPVGMYLPARRHSSP